MTHCDFPTVPALMLEVCKAQGGSYDEDGYVGGDGRIGEHVDVGSVDAGDVVVEGVGISFFDAVGGDGSVSRG